VRTFGGKNNLEFEVLRALSRKPTLLKDVFMALNGQNRKSALETLDMLERQGYVQNLGLRKDSSQYYSFGTAFRLTVDGSEHLRAMSHASSSR